MSIAIPLQTPRRELAHRANGGLEITLFWNSDDDTTSIEVWHPETEETITFDVPRNRALDAFYHPFAHLGNQPKQDLQPAQIDNSWRNTP
jgi:hypothetical protein